MRKPDIRGLCTLLSRLDGLVARMGRLPIGRRGRPLARRLPARTAGAVPSHAGFRARMPRLATGGEVFVRPDRDDPLRPSGGCPRWR